VSFPVVRVELQIEGQKQRNPKLTQVCFLERSILFKMIFDLQKIKLLSIIKIPPHLAIEIYSASYI
jgi:hypothetical protein